MYNVRIQRKNNYYEKIKCSPFFRNNGSGRVL